MKNEKIDIVLPWVDGSDPKWLSEKRKYQNESVDKAASADNRFNDWGLLKYWFRAVENCLPWVNKVFFITCGHLPEFLDVNCEKLRIVKHSDYIPAEYLPTFNSNTILMNLFRIEDLSENFILFNDDLFPIDFFPEDYYFSDNMPCDEAIESVFISKGTAMRTTLNMILNDMAIINRNFDKKKCQNSHPEVWFSSNYGEDYLKRNRLMQYWNFFAGFTNKHMANAYKKSIFEKIWKKEPDYFSCTFKNRFRGYEDINDYVVRFWQICEGIIKPRLTVGKNYRVYPDNYEDIAKEIEGKNVPMVCINEFCTSDEFFPIKKRMQEVFEKLFPNPSSFEFSGRGGGNSL